MPRATPRTDPSAPTRQRSWGGGPGTDPPAPPHRRCSEGKIWEASCPSSSPEEEWSYPSCLTMGRAGQGDEAKNRGRPEVLDRSRWSAGVASVDGWWFEVKTQSDGGDIGEFPKVRQNLGGALFLTRPEGEGGCVRVGQGEYGRAQSTHNQFYLIHASVLWKTQEDSAQRGVHKVINRFSIEYLVTCPPESPRGRVLGGSVSLFLGNKTF